MAPVLNPSFPSLRFSDLMSGSMPAWAAGRSPFNPASASDIGVKRCRESSPGPVIGPVIDQALSDSLGVDRPTTPNQYAPDSSFHRRRSGWGHGEMALCYLRHDPGHGNTGVRSIRATGCAVLCAPPPPDRKSVV